MLVSSDAPLPGATNKHNGQPLAEPGKGADGDQRGARRPIALSMRVSAGRETVRMAVRYPRILRRTGTRGGCPCV